MRNGSNIKENFWEVSGYNKGGGDYMSVSLIIPAFNEESIIEQNIYIAMQFMCKNFSDYEVIVVDDGSSDKTVEFLTKTGATGIALGKNYGKGAAIKSAMLYCDSDYIFFTDADLPYPLDFILRGIDALQTFDVVCGRRFGKYPFGRRVMSTTYNYVAGAILNMDANDLQCGIKGFTKNAGHNIFSRCRMDGFAFDTEAVFIANQLGYKISSIDVPVSHRINSKVNVARDSLEMLADLIKIRRRFEKGEYNLQKIFY